MRRRLPFIALVVVAASLSVHCTVSPAPDAGGTPATGVVETSAPASPEPSADAHGLLTVTRDPLQYRGESPKKRISPTASGSGFRG